MSYKNIIIVGNSSGLLSKENGQKIDTFDCVVRMGSFKIKGFEKYVGTKLDLYRLAWDRIFVQKNNSLSLGNVPFKNCNLLFLEPDYHDAHFEAIKDANLFFARKIFNKQRFLDIRFKLLFNIDAPQCIFHEFITEWIIKKYNIKEIFYYNIKDRIQLFLDYNKHCTVGDKFINEHGPLMPSGGLCTIDYIIKTMPDSNIYVTGFDGFKTRYYWRNYYEYFDSHNSVSEVLIYRHLLKTGRIIEL